MMLAPGFLAGQSAPSGYAALKGEMKVMEAVIDETMAQQFAPPFGLLEKAKAAYVPDFGLVFGLEVNLYPLRTPNPFNPRPLTAAELEEARKITRERIEGIRKSLPRLLADHAISLRDLNQDQSMAVVVHLFHLETELEPLPTQVVVEARKADLDQYWEKKLSYQQLVEKMKILEL
jgi:hypothetical protein